MPDILAGFSSKKDPEIRGSHQLFCSFQLPIQILEGATEVALLFLNQSGVSEPEDRSY